MYNSMGNKWRVYYDRASEYPPFFRGPLVHVHATCTRPFRPEGPGNEAIASSGGDLTIL